MMFKLSKNDVIQNKFLVKKKCYRQKGQHVVNRSEFISSLSLQRETKNSEKILDKFRYAGDIEFLSRIIVSFFLYFWNMFFMIKFCMKTTVSRR